MIMRLKEVNCDEVFLQTGEGRRGLFSNWFLWLFMAILFISVVCVVPRGPYNRAILESCKGCQLNRLPEVKSFINEDLRTYRALEFKHVQGAPPELILYNTKAEVKKRVPLSEMTRAQINQLLLDEGFEKYEKQEEEEEEL